MMNRLRMEGNLRFGEAFATRCRCDPDAGPTVVDARAVDAIGRRLRESRSRR